MADTITFTPGHGGTALTVTPIPGTYTAGGEHDDAGSGNITQARKGVAASGSVEVELNDGVSPDTEGVSVSDLALLHEQCATDDTSALPVGEGNVTVTGDGAYSTVSAYAALVDIDISSDAALKAKISWKGRSVF